MNYLKIPSALLLTTGLVACSKSDSGTKFNPANIGTYKEVQDLSAAPIRLIGQKKLEFSKPADQKVIDSFDTIGCRNPKDGYGSTGDPDPTLRPGDEILQKFSSNSQEVHLSVLSKKTLKEVTPDSMSYISKLLSFSIVEAGGEILNGNPEKLVSCKVNKTDGDFEPCKSPEDEISKIFNDRGRDFISKVPTLGSLECSLRQSASSTSSSEYSMGTYKLENGAEIQALFHQYVQQGDVSCHGKILGKGSRTTISLRSNDVMPVGSFHYCGGVTIIYASSIKLDKMTIESNRSEVISGTLRK